MLLKNPSAIDTCEIETVTKCGGFLLIPLYSVIFYKAKEKLPERKAGTCGLFYLHLYLWPCAVAHSSICSKKTEADIVTVI